MEKQPKEKNSIKPFNAVNTEIKDIDERDYLEIANEILAENKYTGKIF